MFTSVSFAEDTTRTWKWERAYNSVVLVSGENVAENIIENPFDQEDSGPHDRPDPNPDSIKPKIIPYCMWTGFFINKIHIVTNYHVVKEFNTLSIYAYNHPYAITEVELVGYDAEIDIAVLQVNEKDISSNYLEFADEYPLIGDDVYAIGHGMSQVWSLTTVSYTHLPLPTNREV